MAAISKLQVRITKYFTCVYGGPTCISIPNVKFLCLNLWLRAEYTDDAKNTNDANNDNAQRTKHDCVTLFV